jgi:hypothetical protein
MPEIWAGRLGEFRASSTAGGGTALTATATYIPFPPIGTTIVPPKAQGHCFVTARNFATAEVVELTFNPWLTVLETNDAMATDPTDWSVYAQDGSASTDIDMDSFDTLANGDFLLIGSHIPFRGVQVDMDGSHLNSTDPSTLSVNYWAGAWTDMSATDGTNTGTITMAQDGLVYWTVPSAWQMVKLIDIYPKITSTLYYAKTPMYWTRWYVSAALDADTLIDGMYAANRSTSYGELLSGQCLEQRIDYGFNGFGCIEALASDQGTANLIVNVATMKDGEFSG